MPTPRIALSPDQIRALCQRGRSYPLSPTQVRGIRETMGLHQRQLARLLNHSPETARSWERPEIQRNYRPMNRATRIAFCQLIEGMLDRPDVTIEELAQAA